MAVSYDGTTQTNRMTQTLNRIDNNASAAKLELGTAAMAVTICSITLGKPSFTGPTGTPAVLTMIVPKSGTASASNTAVAARIRDGANSDIVTGLTVGTSATDIVLNSNVISNGQTVTITAFTLTHAT